MLPSVVLFFVLDVALTLVTPALTFTTALPGERVDRRGHAPHSLADGGAVRADARARRVLGSRPLFAYGRTGGHVCRVSGGRPVA